MGWTSFDPVKIHWHKSNIAMGFCCVHKYISVNVYLNFHSVNVNIYAYL